MTVYQYEQAAPTRDSILYHIGQGCVTRHRSNKALDRCEDKHAQRCR